MDQCVTRRRLSGRWVVVTKKQGGKPLYFRGRRIIDTVIKHLTLNHNLGKVRSSNALLTSP